MQRTTFGRCKQPRAVNLIIAVTTQHCTTVRASSKVEHLQLYMVYGGEAEKGRSLDDFYVLVLRNWTWKKLFLMQFPPARHLQTMSDMRSD